MFIRKKLGHCGVLSTIPGNFLSVSHITIYECAIGINAY